MCVFDDIIAQSEFKNPQFLESYNKCVDSFVEQNLIRDCFFYDGEEYALFKRY